jgi:hypothetical protein
MPTIGDPMVFFKGPDKALRRVTTTPVVRILGNGEWLLVQSANSLYLFTSMSVCDAFWSGPAGACWLHLTPNDGGSP